MSVAVDKRNRSAQTAGDLGSTIHDLVKRRGEKRHSFVQRLESLHGLSESLLTRDASVAAFSNVPGVAFLADFLRKSNLCHLLKREFANIDALDRFVRVDGRKGLRLVPRGLVCHWLAGNVPLLGVFSWAVSALVGNVNLIRLSTRQNDLVSPLLETLASRSEAGAQMASETAIVQFDRDDVDAHRQMSEAADVRLAWGGKEAIEAVKTLPSRWDCEDIVMGPRVSLAVVDPATITTRGVTRLASDVIYFDQMACSSPQILFLKGQRDASGINDFVEELAVALNAQSKQHPRHPLDFSETYQIQLDRVRVLLSGGMIRSDDQTQWTLAVLDAPRSDIFCANRFLQLIPYAELDTVYENIPRNVQTVVTHLGSDDFGEFSERAAQLGVCRFPTPGEGNHFELPWDGGPLASRLVRWVTRTEPGA